MQSPSNYSLNKKRGFTLAELLVVIALFVLLLFLGFFMSTETLKGAMSRSDQATIVSFLQNARSRSMANLNQSVWGVCYLAPNYIVFKGNACLQTAAAESSPANAGVALMSDFAHAFPVVVFTQLSGTTTAATITLIQDGRQRVITINNEGTIVW